MGWLGKAKSAHKEQRVERFKAQGAIPSVDRGSHRPTQETLVCIETLPLKVHSFQEGVGMDFLA